MGNRMVYGLAAAVLAASLLTGCGGTTKKDPGNEAAATSAARTAKSDQTPSTPPTMTAMIGQRPVNAYELKGVDLQKKIRTGQLVMVNDTIYFHGGTKPSHLCKVTVKDETISDYVVIGESGSIVDLATNGKLVVFRSADGAHLSIYDGREAVTRGEWPGELVGVPGKDEFYCMRGPMLRAGVLEDGEFKATRDVIRNYKLQPEFTKVMMRPVDADANTVYLKCTIKKNGANTQGVPTLIAFDKFGKEVRRYEGVSEMPRDWVVTKDYIIHCGSRGMFRILNRTNGQVVGETRFNMRPFALCAMGDNKVLVYDDRSEKLYRIDF